MISSAINKSSFPERIVVTRNVDYNGIDKFLNISDDLLRNGSEKEVREALIGNTVTEYGFMSTTGFIKSNVSDIQFQITIPKKSKAIYTQPFSMMTYKDEPDYLWNGESDYSTDAGEFEILIQKNSDFVITDVEMEGNQKLIKMILKG